MTPPRDLLKRLWLAAGCNAYPAMHSNKEPK